MDRPASATSTPEADPHVPLPEVVPGDQRYFSALDGARALAAIGVLINHVGVLSGFNGRNPTLGQYISRADVGVSIFFVLSGFLLYRPFVVDRLAGVPMRDVSTYARRRLLRIFPGYWVALTIVAFVMRSPPFREPHSMVAHYLLLQTYDINQVVGGPIQQSWTLATELSFYIFLPLFAWYMARKVRSPERQVVAELVGVGALWAGSMGIQLVVLARGTTPQRFGMYGTWLPFRLNEFALGMGLGVLSAWFVHGRNRVPTWLQGAAVTVAMWAVALFLFWVTATRLGLPPSPLLSPKEAFAMRALYSFAALFVIIPCVFAARRAGPVRWAFANPVMVWLGLGSYGIYLWHEAWQDQYLRWFGFEPLRAPFMGMLVFTLVLSVLSGAASWYLVERPAIRLGRLVGTRSRSAAQ